MAETFVFLLGTAAVFLLVGFVGAGIAKYFFGDEND